MNTASGPTAPHPPLQGMDRVIGTLVLALATFMNVLDSSIANVSLPAIAGDLGASVHQGTWVITSFGIATAISMPLTGWLTQRFGQVRLFVASVLLFVLASFLCGQSPTIEWLIAFRVLQGLVAGPMMPLSQILVMSSHPPERAGAALSIWSMTILIAPIVGPLLGGWISDNMHWAWIFYINLPIGLLCAAMTWIIYRRRETVRRKVPVDAIGLALVVIWVGAFQVMLDTGKEDDWFESTTIVWLGLVALIGFAVFVVWELTDSHPIVNLKTFRNRNYTLGVIALSGGFALFSANVVLLPLWLQQSMGYTATWAGLILAPVGVIAIMSSPLAGKAIDRGYARTIAVISFFSFALSFWLRAQFNVQADFVTIVLPMFFQGVGGALFFISTVAISFSYLPPSQLPLASGLSNFVRISAGAFGTSLGTTLWDARSRHHRVHLIEDASREGWTLDHPIYDSLRAAGFNQEQVRAQLERLIEQQAATLAVNDVFLISTVFYLVLIVPVILAKPVSVKRR